MTRAMLYLLAAGALALACDKKPSDGAGASTSASGGGAAASAGATGIKECDEYIAKIAACLAKDPKLKEASEAGFKAQTEGWKESASHDKDGTRALCKTALDTIAYTYPSCK